MRLLDQSKCYMGQNFALSSNFVSDWDQVPGIRVKSGPEVFAIFVFCFYLEIAAFLAFSDTCIRFYAKFWTYYIFLGNFSLLVREVQEGQFCGIYVEPGFRHPNLGAWVADQVNIRLVSPMFMRFWDRSN